MKEGVSRVERKVIDLFTVICMRTMSAINEVTAPARSAGIPLWACKLVRASTTRHVLSGV